MRNKKIYGVDPETGEVLYPFRENVVTRTVLLNKGKDVSFCDSIACRGCYDCSKGKRPYKSWKSYRKTQYRVN